MLSNEENDLVEIKKDHEFDVNVIIETVRDHKPSEVSNNEKNDLVEITNDHKYDVNDIVEPVRDDKPSAC